VIVFQGSFHGRTVGTMSLTTSKTIYRAGYQPLMPGVFVAPFPYAYRYGWEPQATSEWCLNELEYLLTTQTAPAETAAMLVEPVLGEGGYVVPPAGFLEGLRRICDRHGILLILDEIQTGLGRTARWFSAEHFGVVPDILIAPRGSPGLPLSGVISARVMQKWPPSHEGTTAARWHRGDDTIRYSGERLLRKPRQASSSCRLRHLQRKSIRHRRRAGWA
jgi:4-aminobutyrate aminotransferase-like enzyme